MPSGPSTTPDQLRPRGHVHFRLQLEGGRHRFGGYRTYGEQRHAVEQASIHRSCRAHLHRRAAAALEAAWKRLPPIQPGPGRNRAPAPARVHFFVLSGFRALGSGRNRAPAPADAPAHHDAGICAPGQPPTRERQRQGQGPARPAHLMLRRRKASVIPSDRRDRPSPRLRRLPRSPRSDGAAAEAAPSAGTGSARSASELRCAGSPAPPTDARAPGPVLWRCSAVHGCSAVRGSPPDARGARLQGSGQAALGARRALHPPSARGSSTRIPRRGRSCKLVKYHRST